MIQYVKDSVFGITSYDLSVTPTLDVTGLTHATPAEVDAYLAARAEAAKPKEVTMRQARLALLGAGLLTQVGTAIAGMSSPQKEAAQIEWEYSNSLHRAQPLVVQLGAALGLTSAQLDDLFVTASKL